MEDKLFMVNMNLLHDVLVFSKNVVYWQHSYWIVGGASIYKQLWDTVEEVHLTTVNKSYPEADTFFTPDLTGFEKVGCKVDVSGADLEASVQVWKRVDKINNNV